ncbi:MAG: LamG domain-containing protein [Planctomycetota bacterium]|jgi:hypothetical protein
MGKRTNLKLMAVAVMVILIGAGSARADLTEGLVAHWKFDEGMGDIAQDSAGSNDGTLVNGPVWTTGQLAGALNFDGSNGVYIEGSGGTGSVLNIYDSNLTLSAWVKPATVPAQGTILARYKSFTGTYRLGISSGTAYINTYLKGSGHWFLNGGSVLEVGTWYHVVGVFDRDAHIGQVYVNGVEDAEGALGPNPLSNDAITRIGCRQGTSDSTFNGLIDDVRIYDRALSAEEVEQLYQVEIPELVSLEVVGPNEVSEDFSAQYKAIAHYDNGGTADVTDSAEWSVDDETIVSITAGLFTTGAIDLPTDITITAEYTEGENTEVAEKQVSIFAICPSGSALDFDGENDYVEVKDDSSLRFSCSDIFSISFWVKPFDDGFMLSKMRTSQRRGVFGYQIRWEPSRFSFNLESSFVKNVNLFTPDNSAPAGSWYYVATVYDNRDMKIYLNGELANSGTFNLDTGSTTPDKNLAIGARSYDSTITRYLNGTIDELAIYNRVLSAEEIVASMHTKLTGDEDGLVAYWDFDEGEGQLAGDLSLYGNDGQLGSGPGEDESDPNWTDFIPPVGICSLEGIVERNMLNVLGMKNDVLDILDEAISKEKALWEYMDIVFKDRDFGNTSKGDVAKAKQKIHSAIQHEEQAESTVERSIEKLEDALDALDVE